MPPALISRRGWDQGAAWAQQGVSLPSRRRGRRNGCSPSWMTVMASTTLWGLGQLGHAHSYSARGAAIHAPASLAGEESMFAYRSARIDSLSCDRLCRSSPSPLDEALRTLSPAPGDQATGSPGPNPPGPLLCELLQSPSSPSINLSPSPERESFLICGNPCRCHPPLLPPPCQPAMAAHM